MADGGGVAGKLARGARILAAVARSGVLPESDLAQLQRRFVAVAEASKHDVSTVEGRLDRLIADMESLQRRESGDGPDGPNGAE